ncbi:MAG TPA: recombinase family protein [Ktedonobacterales bacterium]|nr:recombinase family protein [Ktedonobacterales bacterium]
MDPAERPALSQLLRAAEQGRFSVLVVYSPDRLTREPRVFLTLHQQFREHDVDIRFALLDVEASDSPASRLTIGTKADAHERRTQLRRSSESETRRGRMQPNEPNEPIV